ncbi:hypothetical protein RRG08_038425 [Elysia crispata]|uniref:Uncharacterized protein n=1 Tax=Elysia crispata TaxID=231223 RepID=A0AAE1AM65_9GAST|nr:hypothetical protein RRG08_038425 [Elysia crispata]
MPQQQRRKGELGQLRSATGMKPGVGLITSRCNSQTGQIDRANNHLGLVLSEIRQDVKLGVIPAPGAPHREVNVFTFHWLVHLPRPRGIISASAV